MVRKNNNKLRVYIGFTDLNKIYPKYSFLLPIIYLLVDSKASHQRLSFLYAYSGYHQIPLLGPDQKCTAFINIIGLYCYKVMLFGLKNIGATYEQSVTKMFRDKIEKSIEVYVDDMLVKGKLAAANHIRNLGKTSEMLRHYKMKLNAAKCIFGVAWANSWDLW